MAFLSGIFSAPAPAAPTAPAAPATPVAAATPSNSNGSAGPISAQKAAPANPGAAPANMGDNAPANPLDAFADYFKPKPVDHAAVKVPTIADPYLGALDPAAFKQQVASTDFASGIPPEVVQKALQGDPQAFMDAINHAAREAFAASAQLSHGLVEHGARSAAERVSSSMDSRIRDFQIKTQNTSNEALSHPAVAPMLNALKMQIAQSNPQLHPEQIQSQAEQYFTQMADVLTAPKKAAEVAAATPKQPNFASYLEN